MKQKKKKRPLLSSIPARVTSSLNSNIPLATTRMTNYLKRKESKTKKKVRVRGRRRRGKTMRKKKADQIQRRARR